MLVAGCGKPKTAHPWLHGTTIQTRVGDWVPQTPVGQPSGITAVQSGELPGSVKLSHLGYVGPVVQTCLDGLSEVEHVRVLQEINLPWITCKEGKRRF